MGFERDAAIIERIVRTVDPAFLPVPEQVMQAAIADMAARAEGDDRDSFLLSAMRLVALADNAHSRVIPNAGFSVLPHRFVVRDARLCAVYEGTCVPVVSVNGVSVQDLLHAWDKFVPGPEARQLVLAGLMLAWPAALALGGLSGPTFEYQLEDGRVLRSHIERCVPAHTQYSENETGASVVGADAFPAPLVSRRGAVWHVRLDDLKRLSADDVAGGVATLAKTPSGAVVDLRGNPGGSFLKALPLVQLLRDQGHGHRCAVLVNGYTFSAAIVVAVLIAHHLGDRAALFGAEMGDRLSFWAEGDLLDLPDSGAKLRYSTAWHDWRTGVPDPTTPAEIAAHLVAGGDLAVRGHPEAKQMEAALSFVLEG